MTTCILLAGGLGTRLREAVPGVPKCLAPVRGTTFLHVQMEHLAAQGVDGFILSLGHMADQVIDAAKTLQNIFDVEWIVEPRPLGTGGATLFAMHQAALSEALVANADTFIEADLSPLLSPLNPGGSEHIRMMVVQSRDGGRFGGVVVNADKAERFSPRGTPCPGLVNAGIYRVHRAAFANFRPGQIFSLEADVVAVLAEQGRVAAAVVAGAFADIGISNDYFRFCEQFAPSR